MFVLTADQIDSRSGPDLVPDALELLAGLATERPFVRTVGDGIQGVPTDGRAALDAALALMRDGRWSVGIGVGQAELAGSAPESSGEAFVRAREAVERARSRAVDIPIALEAGRRGETIEPLVQLLAGQVAERSEATWRVIDRLAHGASGVAVARDLGITPQAVSAHRRGARWDTEQRARESLATLLDELCEAKA